MSEDNAQVVSVGIEKLLKKLKNDGIEKGQKDAEKIIEKSQKAAEKIISNAKSESEKIIADAIKKAKFIETAGRKSLLLAARNTTLELKSFFLEKFSAKLQKAISLELKDKEILKKMIIQVAGDSGLSSEKNSEVVLPQRIFDSNIENLQVQPDKIKNDILTKFVATQLRSQLKEGVTFSIGNNHQKGVIFKLTDKNVQVEFDEKSITDILLKHLQPRFRAILEGVIN